MKEQSFEVFCSKSAKEGFLVGPNHTALRALALACGATLLPPRVQAFLYYPGDSRVDDHAQGLYDDTIFRIFLRPNEFREDVVQQDLAQQLATDERINPGYAHFRRKHKGRAIVSISGTITGFVGSGLTAEVSHVASGVLAVSGMLSLFGYIGGQMHFARRTVNPPKEVAQMTPAITIIDEAAMGFGPIQTTQ